MNICAHAVMCLVNTMPQGRNMPHKDILMSPEHTQADTDTQRFRIFTYTSTPFQDK
jgi:hypothetical protein